MENLMTLFGLLLASAIVIRILASPIRLVWKILLNAACGFVCLWLLNWVSGFTGILFPLNPVTVIVAGLLGIPGIALLSLIEVFL